MKFCRDVQILKILNIYANNSVLSSCFAPKADIQNRRSTPDTGISEMTASTMSYIWWLCSQDFNIPTWKVFSDRYIAIFALASVVRLQQACFLAQLLCRRRDKLV